VRGISYHGHAALAPGTTRGSKIDGMLRDQSWFTIVTNKLYNIGIKFLKGLKEPLPSFFRAGRPTEYFKYSRTGRTSI
jgi:hypothetical protein